MANPYVQSNNTNGHVLGMRNILCVASEGNNEYSILSIDFYT
jgi:hypothetical protein